VVGSLSLCTGEGEAPGGGGGGGKSGTLLKGQDSHDLDVS
jgi:hypothetical protein